ncbi:MAG: hypothetical protein CBC16_00175 [Verrucomicrobia bacterium TMED56]|nr:MAG: hypothetical protein CBC16_00175 [Verrucomicrobia bacterium TMED56]
MKIYGIQFSPVWENKPKNFQRIKDLLETTYIIPNSLLVLPETFSTGFSLNTDITSMNEPSTSLAFCRDLALKYKSWIMGGVILKEGDNFYNRLILVSPIGDLCGHYDKIHLIPNLGENQVHTPGIGCSLFEVQDFRICPAICYDLRFPELFRKGIQMGANLFVVIACWPKVRIKHWKILLQARAIENQSYIIGINRIGSEPNNEYSGCSMIICPKGEILSECKEGEFILEAEIKISEIKSWRTEFPVLEHMKEKTFLP